MHLSSIDLNLLVVLDALLETRSTTAAAKRLALSQPATSHALGRLRDLFDDPLLVREGRGLAATPFARDLAPRVRSALDAVALAVARRERFDPRTSTRTFDVGTGDYAASVLAPKLVGRLARAAPGIDLFLKPNQEPTVDELARDDVELVFAPIGPESVVWIRREPLFEERFVCAVRADHPLGRGRLTLDRYCAYAHILVAPRGVSRDGAVDAELARLGRSRRVAVAVPSFFVAPAIVVETDYVLTIASRIGRSLARELGLRLVEPPIEIPGFTIGMHWHARYDDDPAHSFLREVIRDVSGAIAKSSSRKTQPAQGSVAR